MISNSDCLIELRLSERTTKLVSKTQNWIYGWINYLLPWATTVMYIEIIEIREDSQMKPIHTGNRILVAMGNN